MLNPETQYPEQFSDYFSLQEPLPEAWQKLMRNLARQGNNRLKRYYKEAQRLLRENGAIHNVFATPESPRPWSFDPVPLIFSQDQWQVLEQGLIQRARLLNLILRDIYGPMELVREGLLPPELIYTHRGFLYPCAGLYHDLDQPLQIYSANLVRGMDGGFWIMDDMVQPPLGSGYALETRIIMTRSFPQMFSNFQVHRLAMFYRVLRNSLTQLAHHNRHDPRIVVLTPGPDHPSYFEHAYFAAYLGYPLVQGGDLIVQDNCVWLKTVDGLKQVDVILSRQRDAFSDPLELRGDSWIGIPGLLEAVRCRNVAITNPLGCGILENPALMAFLPGLCRHLLGEELLVPSVASWWCGQKDERKYVLEHLDELVIKPIHPMADLPALIPAPADTTRNRRWRELISKNPHLFVAQQHITFATYPAYAEDHLEARHSSLNLFLTAQNGSYVMMPGGLCRTNSDSDQLLLPHITGGQIKDLWVLTDEPDQQTTLWRQMQPDQIIHPLTSALPSRAAENLFWAARYAERAEQTARLLRSILIKMREVNEGHDIDTRMGLNHLLRALTHITQTYPGFCGDDARSKLEDPRTELYSVILDSNRVGGLYSTLECMGRAAFVVRDLLPEDAWRVIDTICNSKKPKISKNQIGSGRMLSAVNTLIVQLAAFSGLTYENMSRETAWKMLNIGRRLERAINLTTLLKTTLVPCYSISMEAQMMDTVLATCNSQIVFRRRYRSFMSLGPVLELLLLDDNYPRALACQLRQLHKHIESLPRESEARDADKDMQLIRHSLEQLHVTDHQHLISINSSDGRYPLLEDMLARQTEELEELSGALTEHYFTPTLPPQQLINISRSPALT